MQSISKTLTILEDYDGDLRNIDSQTIVGEESVAFADVTHSSHMIWTADISYFAMSTILLFLYLWGKT